MDGWIDRGEREETRDQEMDGGRYREGYISY